MGGPKYAYSHGIPRTALGESDSILVQDDQLFYMRLKGDCYASFIETLLLASVSLSTSLPANSCF